MGRYENILSSINHEEWPEAELQGMALSILDSLADLMKRRELSEVVYALEMCGILGRKEALHYIGEGRAQQVIKEATGLLQSLPTLPVLPYLRLSRGAARSKGICVVVPQRYSHGCP